MTPGLSFKEIQKHMLQGSHKRGLVNACKLFIGASPTLASRLVRASRSQKSTLKYG